MVVTSDLSETKLRVSGVRGLLSELGQFVCVSLWFDIKRHLLSVSHSWASTCSGIKEKEFSLLSSRGPPKEKKKKGSIPGLSSGLFSWDAHPISLYPGLSFKKISKGWLLLKSLYSRLRCLCVWGRGLLFGERVMIGRIKPITEADVRLKPDCYLVTWST